MRVSTILPFATAFVAAGYFCLPANAQWTWPVIISESNIRLEAPEIVTSGAVIAVVYHNLSADPTLPRIVNSSFCGDLWDDPIILDDTSTDSWGHPKICQVGDTLHVVWAGILPSGRVVVLYRRSTDLGESWHAIQQLTEDYAYMKFPAIATAGNRLVCLYNATLHSIPNDTVFVMGLTSSDGGRTWSQPFRVHRDINTTYPMTLLQSQGRFHLVYSEPGPDALEIAYMFSDDSGLTWSPPVLISPVDVYDGQWPRASVDTSGFLAACWFDYKYGSGGGGFYGDILMNYSSDNGQTWHGEIRVTYEHKSLTSAILADNQDIHVAYEDIRDGNQEIYYRWSSDRGLSWSTEERLTDDDSLSSYDPALALSYCGEDKTLHLVWSQEFDYPVIVYSKLELTTGIDVEGGGCEPQASGAISVYPNPFNSSAQLKFTLTEAAQVRVEIFNMLGQLAGVEVAGIFPSGAQVIYIDAEAYGLIPGVYFLRVWRGKDSRTILLTLLR